MEAQKKTGMTPTAEAESPALGEVLGIAACKVALVKLRDGHGEEVVKFAFIVAPGKVYFIDERAARVTPAQTWASRAIMNYLNGSSQDVPQVESE